MEGLFAGLGAGFLAGIIFMGFLASGGMDQEAHNEIMRLSRAGIVVTVDSGGRMWLWDEHLRASIRLDPSDLPRLGR